MHGWKESNTVSNGSLVDIPISTKTYRTNIRTCGEPPEPIEIQLTLETCELALHEPAERIGERVMRGLQSHAEDTSIDENTTHLGRISLTNVLVSCT